MPSWRASQLVLADRVGVRVAVEHFGDGARVKPAPTAISMITSRSKTCRAWREVGLVDRGEQLALHALRAAQVNHAVQVEGVADRPVRVEAEPLGLGEPGDPRLGRARLRFRHAVLPAEHAQEVSRASFG